MNPQIPDELISAYFDGEVTPEERAVVESLVTESDEAQRELNETARLSALLHSFPRESAPGELVGNVLQQTAQMPLPSQPDITTPLSRRELRAWKAALISTVISITSTAVACFLIVRNFNDHQGGSAVADNRLKSIATSIPASRPQEPTTMSDLARMEKSDEKSDRDQLLLAKQETAGAVHSDAETMKRVAPAPSSGSASTAAAAGPAADGSRRDSPQLKANDAQLAAMGAKPGLAMQTPTVQLDGTYANFGNILSNGVVLEGLREGKVYFPQVADPENNVAVVDVQVVDVDKGFDTFQVLLTKRSIQSRSTNENKKAAQAKLRQSDGAETELVVIYLVAPGEVLAQVLKDVELHPDLVRGWSSQPPLQLANNDDAKSPVRKKAESTTAQSADKKSESDKPGASADETVPDMAEANQAVQAFMDRNNAYAFAANSNSERQIEPKEPVADVNRNLAEVAKKDADGTLEKAKGARENRRAGGSGGASAAATEQAASNYFLPIRVNNPEVANPAYNRAMPLNPANVGGFGGQGALGNQAAAKPQRDINTPVRMLLVLHQAQAEDAQGTPAPPGAPAKPGQQ